MSTEFPCVVRTRPPRAPQPSGGGLRVNPPRLPAPVGGLQGAAGWEREPSVCCRGLQRRRVPPAGSAPARSSAPRSPAALGARQDPPRPPLAADARAAGGCSGPG